MAEKFRSKYKLKNSRYTDLKWVCFKINFVTQLRFYFVVLKSFHHKINNVNFFFWQWRL